MVTVHSVPLACEVTASPSRTVPDRPAIVCVPSVVQVVLSVDIWPVNVDPLRVIRRYLGTVPDTAVVRVVVAPDVVRYSTKMPLPGVTSTENCTDPALVSARTITPALAHALVLLCAVTWALTFPVPVCQS